MPSIINATTTNGVAVSGDNSGALALQTNNGTTAVTISTGQNVGIGTTSPTNPIQTYKLGELSSSSNNIRNLAYFQADTTVSNSSIIFDTNPSAGQNLRGFRFGYQSSEFSITRFHTDKTTGVVNDLTVDSSGNVGIGTSSPAAQLEVVKSSAIHGLFRSTSASGYTSVRLYNDQNTAGRALEIDYFGSTYSGGEAAYIATTGAYPLTLGTSNTERMRINSSGDLLLGTTDNAMSSGVGFKFFASTTTPYCGQVQNNASGSNTYHFFNTNATNNGYRFYVNVDGGIRNYSGNNVNISDERTKENIEAAGSYLNKICSIPVKLFNYKDEPRNFGKTLGVIAQDVEKIAPEFVNNEGWLEEEQKYDTPLKSVYTTDMMFALMKCIQELKAELDATKAEVQALKGVA